MIMMIMIILIIIVIITLVIMVILFIITIADDAVAVARGVSTRVGMGSCKYSADLYMIAYCFHYTCKDVIRRLSLVSALYIIYCSMQPRLALVGWPFLKDKKTRRGSRVG